MLVAQDPQAALDAARARWKDANIADYRFHVQRTCFCPPPYARRYRLEVRKARPVHPPAPIRSYATVPRLFRFIQGLVDGKGTVSVTYGRRGVPLTVTADPIPMAIDDELTITAGGLRRLR